MRRRATLAAMATVPLAGCGGSVTGEQRIDSQFVVRGLEHSRIYNEYEFREPWTFGPNHLFDGNDLVLQLSFDPDGDYDPSSHTVYLKADDRVVDSGVGGGSFSEGITAQKFYLQRETAIRRDTFRVVSLKGDDAYEDVTIEVTESNE